MTDTVWTNADEDGLASNPDNWSNGIGEGYNVIFNDTSTDNCTFDYSGQLGTFTMASGYTGTVTQSSNIYIDSFDLISGTFTGNTSKWTYCSSYWKQHGGIVSFNTVNIKFLNDGELKYLSGTLRQLEVPSNVTVEISGTGFAIGGLLNYGEIVLNCDVQSNAGNKNLTDLSGTVITNENWFKIYFYVVYDKPVGTIDGNLKLFTEGIDNATLKLSCDQTLIDDLIIESTHATYTCTLDLNGYDLECDSLTLGTRGILENTSGTVSTLTTGSITVGNSAFFATTNINFDKSKVVGQNLTWSASSAGNASAAENWSLLRAPFYNDNIVFDGTSVFNCTWDVAIDSLGTFTIAAGYTGTITQSSDMYISGYSQDGGTFTGVATKWVYCSGNFVKTAGIFTHEVTKINMIGIDKTISFNDPQILMFLKVSNNTTCYCGGVLRGLEVGSGIYLNFTQSPSCIALVYSSDSQTQSESKFLNYGYIRGNIQNVISLTIDRSIILGNIDSVKIEARSTTRSNRVVTILDNPIIGTFEINSDHAKYTCTLDLNGHNLTASSITVGTRGILQCGEGTITTASLDSSAGTITPETATWKFTGNGTIKTKAGDKLHTLQIDKDSTISMESDIETIGSISLLDNDEDESSYLDTKGYDVLSSSSVYIGRYATLKSTVSGSSVKTNAYERHEDGIPDFSNLKFIVYTNIPSDSTFVYRSDIDVMSNADFKRLGDRIEYLSNSDFKRLAESLLYSSDCRMKREGESFSIQSSSDFKRIGDKLTFPSDLFIIYDPIRQNIYLSASLAPKINAGN